MFMLRVGAVSLVLIGACMFFNPDYYGADQSMRDFFRLPNSEQKDRFRKLDIESQYGLLVFGNDSIHPPAVYIATEFAKQGPVVVPFLKNKLKSEQRELAIRDIALVLSELDGLKLYDVSKDSELMALLDRRANEMQGIWKRATLEMVFKIRSVH